MTTESDATDKQFDGKNDGFKPGEENGNITGSKELEEIKKELDALKKGNSSKDAKIAQYQARLKELESIDLSKKTVEEQLEEFKRKNLELEQIQSFNKAFKDSGLDTETFKTIINEQSYEAQAEKFRKLIDEKTKLAADKAVENYKLEQLEKAKKGGVSNKDNNQSDYDPNKVTAKKQWNKWK